MRIFLNQSIFLITLVTLLSGCEALKNFKLSNSNADEKEYANWDAATFHSKAREAMKSENYQKAIKLYETLESRYPFGQYAAQTQLDIAYAYYKNDDPEAAVAAADRFIKINPRSPNVDYAYYLKGLVNFNRSIGFIDRFLPTDQSQRNPSNVKESYENFQELIHRFPDSEYVPDAKQRMMALRNNMAMYEVHVARFYLKRKAYVAAANRAGYVINEYQRTPAVPHALQVMEKAYGKLELNDLASDTQRVFKENYPNGIPESSNLQQTTMIQWVWDIFGFEQ